MQVAAELNHIFISYSHEDRKWLDRLLIILKPLTVNKVITPWSDTEIEAGSEWQSDIDAALARATVGVLLVTPAFCASDYITTYELPALFRAARNHGLRILWVSVRDALYGDLGLSAVQAVNDPKRPLASLSRADQDRVLVGIARKIQDTSVASDLAQRTGTRRALDLPDRNSMFTGRADVIKQLRERLVSSIHIRGHVVSGLGGVGKTQLALEYAYQCQDEYKTVLWASAQDDQTIKAAFSRVAAFLDLPMRSADDRTDVCMAVKEWLETNQDWLLVLDNADHPQVVKPYLPRGGRGHVLITSRAHVFDVQGVATPVVMDCMTAEESVAFLSRRTQRSGEEAAMKELATELGFLPLALEQAGAYINVRECSVTTYLGEYRTQKLALLEEAEPFYGRVPMSEKRSSVARKTGQLDKGNTSDEHFITVRTTSLMSFRELPAVSREVLLLSSFVCPDDIPFELFTVGSEEMGSLISTELSTINDHPLALDELLTPLAHLSLITKHVDLKTYSIHRLVQLVVQDEMPVPDRRLWAERVIRALALAWPRHTGFASWDARDRLLPHAIACHEYVREFDFNFSTAATVLEYSGDYFLERAQFADAERLFNTARAIREQEIALDRNHLASALIRLARAKSEQGDDSQAEQLYGFACQILQRATSADPTVLAIVFNNLGLISARKGDDASAQRNYEKALGIWNAIEHISSLSLGTLLANMADLYSRQGRESESAELRQLAIRRQELTGGRLEGSNVKPSSGRFSGVSDTLEHTQETRISNVITSTEAAAALVEHPAVAENLHVLAFLYAGSKEYGKAEQVFRKALAIREKTLGHSHPDTAATCHSLAWVLAEQGKYHDAELHFLRALQIRKDLPSVREEDLLESMEGLARGYTSSGKYAEAASLFEEALKIRVEKFGPERAETATAALSLGHVRELQGNAEIARPLYMRALETREGLFGRDHRSALDVVERLGRLSFANHSYSDAVTWLERALNTSQPSSELEELGMADIAYCVGVAQEELGDVSAAENSYKHALDIRGRVLGDESERTLEVVSGLSKLYAARQNYLEALEWYKRGLSMCERIFGENSKEAATAAYNIGFVHEKLGQRQEADKCYQRALDIRKTQFPEDSESIIETLETLGKLYLTGMQYEQAELAFQESLESRIRTLGFSRAETVNDFRALAATYQKQDKWAQLTDLYERTLLSTDTLGIVAVWTADLYFNLGVLYYEHGREDEATASCSRALDLYHRLLGSEHKKTKTAKQYCAFLAPGS